MDKIKVVELFAGVGGFRIGLEKASDNFEVVWSNQWEPATKSQEASEIYIKRFGNKNHSNVDIAKVSADEIPEYNLLVGGFPCQDYSVAKNLGQSKGITGKKGVLWWEIHRILKDSAHKPEFILLENVDRLLSSPANQRGRDFAIILASLSDLGYIVEWRIINAAEYGFPQRRRRVFITGYHKNSGIYKKILKEDIKNWVLNKGTLAKEFKINQNKVSFPGSFKLEGDLIEISNNFNKGAKFSPFQNCGLMVNREIFTIKVFPDYEGKIVTLGEIILPEKEIPEEFFVNGDYEKWKYLKGAKNEKRFNKSKNVYYPYSEGAMIFPDPLDKPSRTIVTGEGGSTPSRFKHVIKTESGRWRRLTPLELERLNMFPENHTEGCTDIKRAFLMGNALVVGVIEKIGKSLVEQLREFK
ncbi:MAG: DNA (cytosine-5-)-methyltransferase [archaeon]